MIVIGVLHLDPLPSSPLYESYEGVMDNALRDARALAEGGVDAILIENYGDKPFLKEVDRVTVSCMSVIAWEVKKETGLPIGINVLRNDPFSALAIAKAVNADFVRVNQLYFISIAPEGTLEGKAGDLMRYRKFIDCRAKVYADVNVKHSHHIVELEDYIENVERSLADALIVTGRTTGDEVDLKELKFIRDRTDLPVFVGSGVNPNNLRRYIGLCDGVIVGTYFKLGNRIDIEKVKRLIDVRNSISDKVETVQL